MGTVSINNIIFSIILIIGDLVQSFHNKQEREEIRYNQSRDTVIHNARLLDTLTDQLIWTLPDHFGISVRFQIINSQGKAEEIDIIFAAMERYGKSFFKVNNTYSIYASKFREKVPFMAISRFANLNGPTLLCDSIRLKK